MVPLWIAHLAGDNNFQCTVTIQVTNRWARASKFDVVISAPRLFGFIQICSNRPARKCLTLTIVDIHVDFVTANDYVLIAVTIHICHRQMTPGT